MNTTFQNLLDTRKKEQQDIQIEIQKFVSIKKSVAEQLQTATTEAAKATAEFALKKESLNADIKAKEAAYQLEYDLAKANTKIAEYEPTIAEYNTRQQILAETKLKVEEAKQQQTQLASEIQTAGLEAKTASDQLDTLKKERDLKVRALAPLQLEVNTALDAYSKEFYSGLPALQRLPDAAPPTVVYKQMTQRLPNDAKGMYEKIEELVTRAAQGDKPRRGATVAAGSDALLREGQWPDRGRRDGGAAVDDMNAMERQTYKRDMMTKLTSSQRYQRADIKTRARWLKDLRDYIARGEF